MTLIQGFVDSVGDLLGTSKYSNANKCFKMLIGTDMTREEYNVSGTFKDSDAKKYEAGLKKLGYINHIKEANRVTDIMKENEVKFSNTRIKVLTQSLSELLENTKPRTVPKHPNRMENFIDTHFHYDSDLNYQGFKKNAVFKPGI